MAETQLTSQPWIPAMAGMIPDMAGVDFPRTPAIPLKGDGRSPESTCDRRPKSSMAGIKVLEVAR
jgi:hypothetical protein